MEQRSEAGKAVLFLVFFACFFATAYATWTELNYFVYAKTTSAEVVRAFRRPLSRVARSNPFKEYVVEYHFKDGEKHRLEKDIATSDRPIDTKKPIEIQYFPGELKKSRLSSNARVWPVAFFLVACSGMTLFAIWLWRAAGAQTKRRKRKRVSKEEQIEHAAEVPGSTFHRVLP